MLKTFNVLIIAVLASLALSGCATDFFKREERIKELEAQVGSLEQQKREEEERFKEVKRMLEQKLSSEIASDEVSLDVSENGLVIILSDNILFDSGKSQLKDRAHSVLDNVSEIVNREVPEKNIGVSGHTDNVAITYSSWKSNWELSTARATTVLHYLESKDVNPKKLSATGYGEHRPVASNDTPEGKAKNRRVEIVILPEFTSEPVHFGRTVQGTTERKREETKPEGVSAAPVSEAEEDTIK